MKEITGLTLGHLCGLLALVGGTLRAEALQPFSYRFSPSGISNCQEEAQEVAKRFETATGAKVIQATCVSGSGSESSITITYLSEKEIPPHSAVFGFFPFVKAIALGKVYRGIFGTLDRCQGELSRLSALYRQQTRLSPVAAYCFPAFLSGYGAAIDGFGTPDRAFTNSGHSLEFGGKTTRAWANVVAALLSRWGATVANVSYFGRSLAAHYFSKGVTLVPHFIQGLGWYLDEANCRSALEDAVEFFNANASAKPAFAAACLSENAGSYFANFVFVNKAPDYWTLQGPVYGTAFDCIQDRPRVLKLLGQSGGKKPQAAVCSLERGSLNSFQMTLLGH